MLAVIPTNCICQPSAALPTQWQQRPVPVGWAPCAWQQTRVVPAAQSGHTRPLPLAVVRGQERRLPTRWQRHATDTLAEAASAESDLEEDLRRYLSGLGWGRAWVDGIVEMIPKGVLKTDVAKAKRVVEALETEGVPSQGVCNMASIARSLLGLDSETEVKPVLDYLKGQGVKGEALVKLLIQHPKLLTYKLSADKKVLEYGRARAAVEVREGSRDKAALVSYWREGVKWTSAPVSPIKPAAV